MATGIDGGIDGGNAGSVVAPAPPPAPLEDTLFASMVASMDVAARTALGAVPVTYQPATGAPVLVRGIFDAAFRLGLSDAHARVEASGPAVFLQLADLPTDPMIDDPTLNIGGVDYRVDQRHPAGFGSILLELRKAG